ncbi:MAG: hypothetical protein WBQ73_03670, partial [Candidatus Babeliales bacterium]
MKHKVYQSIIGSMILGGFSLCYGGQLLHSLQEITQKLALSPQIKTDNPSIFNTVLEEKQNKLQSLLQEKEEFLAGDKEQKEKRNAKLRATLTYIQENKNDLLKGKNIDADFIKSKLELYNSIYTELELLQQLVEQILSIFEQHSSLLEKYLQDPQLMAFKKTVGFEEGKAVYSFKDLKKMEDLHDELIQAKVLNEEQLKNSDSEYEHRKETAAVEGTKLKKLKDERNELRNQLDEGIDVQKQLDILDLKMSLLTEKQRKALLSLKELEYKKGLIKTRLFYGTLKIDLLKKLIKFIKPLVRVGEVELTNAKEELTQEQQKAFVEKEALRKELEQLVLRQQKLKEYVVQLSQQYGFLDSMTLDEWQQAQLETAQDFVNFLELIQAQGLVSTIQQERELVEAKMALLDKRVDDLVRTLDVKNSFYKIMSRSFDSEDEVSQALKLYDAPRAEVKANLSVYKEKRGVIQNYSSRLKQKIHVIDEMSLFFEKDTKGIFSKNKKELLKANELLSLIKRYVEQQDKLVGKISITYGGVIDHLDAIAKQIDFIITELSAITIWYRPSYAISWQGMKALGPDFMNFISKVYAYVTSLKIDQVTFLIVEHLSLPWNLLFIVLALSLIFLIIGIVWWGLPLLIDILQSIPALDGGMAVVLRFFLICLTFLHLYFWGISVWLSFFLFLKLYPLPDPYLYVVFYLVSIPYFMYLIRGFIYHIIVQNEEHNYLFISYDFQQRFI